MRVTAKDGGTIGPQTRRHRHGWPLRRSLRSLRVRVATSLLDIPDTLLIAMSLASVVLLNFACLALHSGHGRIALLTGVPALVAFLVASHVGVVPDVLDETGKGEIANLSHEEFDRLVERVELSAVAEPAPLARDGDHFEQLVHDALDELPEFLQASVADNVAVLISHDADERGYYGLYSGGTVVYGGDYHHTIVIYRDTLVRDFGHDPDELRHEVATTVRHELAHHLGADERRVAELGL